MAKKRILTQEEKDKIAKAKEELKEYRENTKYIDEKRDDFEELKTRMYKTTGELSKTKTSNKSAIKDKTGDGVSRMEELENDYDEKLEELLLKKFVIDNKIDQLEQPYKNVLFMRYARRKGWNQVAEDLGYSVQGIYRKHGEALYLYSNL